MSMLSWRLSVEFVRDVGIYEDVLTRAANVTLGALEEFARLPRWRLWLLGGDGRARAIHIVRRGGPTARWSPIPRSAPKEYGTRGRAGVASSSYKVSRGPTSSGACVYCSRRGFEPVGDGCAPAKLRPFRSAAVANQADVGAPTLVAFVRKP
jgi:hypothetical protein